MKYLLVLLALVTVVAPKTKTAKNMLFIVDKSGSMGADKTKDAMQQFINFAGAPVDDGSICVYQFGKEANKWKHGWKKLPSKKALDKANNFLSTTTIDNGETNIVPALVAALREPKKEMMIIIISDGQFSEEDVDIKATIQKWQRWRVKHGYGKASIGCVGVGSGHSDSLKAIAGMKTGIGYYHVEKKKEEELCEEPF